MCTLSISKICFRVLLISYSSLLINGAIPFLSVNKVNSKLINRNRQETLEICRLFNEENSHRQINNVSKFNLNNGFPTRRRIKRDIDSNKIDNPVLKQEDILRVETIVDKLYDDLEENGNHISHRHRNVKNTTKGIENKLKRRFNFAPGQLLGQLEESNTLEPLAKEKTLEEVNSTAIPWIKNWKHGILPYFIDPNSYDSVLADIILKAFDYIEKVSCIRLQRLREKPVDKQSLQYVEWLYITNPSGIKQCVHSNERVPNTGVQMVVLGYDCLSQGEIAHEVMHVLGFSHEHIRSDRDRYITILWHNIKPGYKKYFETRHDGGLLNLPYDYASVLHYPPRAFSKNGQITVMAQSGIKVGQREALSELDIEKISMIYGHECIKRNKDYLLKTCPSVVKANPKPQAIMENEIEEYFKDRVWPYGIVNYQMKDKLEFTAEEEDNIRAVFNHIEKETCIEFRDITDQDDVSDKNHSTEINTVTSGETSHKQIDNNETLASNEIKSNFSKRHKMTIKFSDLSTVTLPDNVKIFNEHETSSEYKRRYHKTRGIIKTKNDTDYKSQKAKQTKSSKKVLPKSPARRHAANVLMLTRSTKPGCECPSAGRPNGNKDLTLNADCFNSVNDLLHLFLHVLGLDHQHNTYDRDSFLHIEWENLTPEIIEEIRPKLPPAASAGFAYDYQSVMHYPWLRIKDGVTNIMYPIWNDGWAMGHWQGLSLTDVQKINSIYIDECEKRKQHIRDV